MILKNCIPEYVPAKNDLIDQTLAQWINMYDGKSEMRIMFVRVNPQEYYFGSKKIRIRVD